MCDFLKFSCCHMNTQHLLETKPVSFRAEHEFNSMIYKSRTPTIQAPNF